MTETKTKDILQDNEFDSKIDESESTAETSTNPLPMPDEDHDAQDGLLEADERESAEIKQIFGTTLPQYLKPVEEMLEQILVGQCNTESLDALSGMIESLLNASSKMGLTNVQEVLSRMNDRILLLEDGQPVDAKLREEFFSDLYILDELAREMGNLEDQPKDSHPGKSLFEVLRNKEGLQASALKKLNTAGIVTTQQFLMARPDEIVAVSGMTIDQVNKIAEIIASDVDLAERPEVSGESRTQKQPKDSAVDSVPDLAAESSSELEALHQQVLISLRKEVELESYIEELRSELRQMRPRVVKYHEELNLTHRKLKEKDQALKQLASKMDQITRIQEETYKQKGISELKIAQSEDNINGYEKRIHRLGEEKRKIKHQSADIQDAVSDLVNSLKPVRRLVVKGRTESYIEELRREGVD